MITHTMLVRFDEPVRDAGLDQYLTDIEKATRATGALRSFATRRHLPVAGEEQIPAFIATVVVQLGVADLTALAALFAAPGVGEVFDRWRDRHSYQVAWVNHEPLS